MKKKGLFVGMLAVTLTLGMVLAGCENSGGSSNGGVDKAALNTAIAAANTAKSGVAIETTAANVSMGKQWVLQADLTAFDGLITAAETARDSSSATQGQVNVAKNALISGIDTFTLAKKNGTGAVLNTGALTAEIAKAKAAKLGVAVDTAAGNVPSATKWVTQGVLDTFEAAIAAAEAKLTETAQGTIDTAVGTLTGAINTFNTAKTSGSKTSGYSMEQLTALIDAATTLNSSVTAAVNGDSIAPDAWWVAETHKTALGTAIATAKAITAAGTPLDNAYTALAGAIDTLNSNKAQGTSTASVKTTLLAAITAADGAKAGVLVAAAAATVPSGSKWATAAQWAPFNAAYNAAVTALGSPNIAKPAVEAATAALTGATATFSSAVSGNGTGTFLPRSIKVTGVNLTVVPPEGDYYLGIVVTTAGSAESIVAAGASGKLVHGGESTIALYETTTISQPSTTRWQGTAGTYYLMVGIYDKDPLTITDFEAEQPAIGGYASVTFTGDAAATLAGSAIDFSGENKTYLGSIAGTVTLTNVPASGIRYVYISAYESSQSGWSSSTGGLVNKSGGFSIPLYNGNGFSESKNITFQLYVEFTDGSYFTINLPQTKIINGSSFNTATSINVGNLGTASLASIKLSGTVTATLDGQTPQRIDILLFTGTDTNLGYASVYPVSPGSNSWVARIASLSTPTTVKFTVLTKNTGDWVGETVSVTRQVYQSDISGIALGTVEITGGN
jgi:hypothetical protein